mmetsp:Transcript_34389/g.74318  ORF Transcript_34389/g.74318 Transcript_34389/m.74318 type:complete len:209 (-) Transcript_34389:490-1116(-)
MPSEMFLPYPPQFVGQAHPRGKGRSIRRTPSKTAMKSSLLPLLRRRLRLCKGCLQATLSPPLQMQVGRSQHLYRSPMTPPRLQLRLPLPRRSRLVGVLLLLPPLWGRMERGRRSMPLKTGRRLWSRRAHRAMRLVSLYGKVQAEVERRTPLPPIKSRYIRQPGWRLPLTLRRRHLPQRRLQLPRPPAAHRLQRWQRRSSETDCKRGWR